MNQLARNVLSNGIGGAWTILLYLAVIPVQVRLLGAEAFGLVGFVASMQTILVLLDLGIPLTLVRELAADSDPTRTFSRALVQTAHSVYVFVAVTVGMLLFFSAQWIAENWLSVESLSVDVVVTTLRWMAVYLMFVWPLNVWTNVLAGLQRFVTLNALKMINVTLAQVGGIIILLATRDVISFTIWLTCNALAMLIAFITIGHWALGGVHLGFRIDREVIRRVWRFSFDLNVNSTLGIVYMQLDRVLISLLLPLRMLGYYNAAYTITRYISAVQEYLNLAILPALTETLQSGSRDLIVNAFIRYAQLSMYLIGGLGYGLMIFSDEILKVWAGDEVAAGGSVAAMLLALGFTLSAGAVSPIFILSLAKGDSRLPTRINLLSLPVFIPSLLIMTQQFGLAGAASAWVGLNVSYFFTLIPISQRWLRPRGMQRWLVEIFFPFNLIGICVFGGIRLLWTVASVRDHWFAAVVIAGMLYAALGYKSLLPTTRLSFIQTIDRFRPGKNAV